MYGINLVSVFFCRLYPVAYENFRSLSEEIVIQGYRIPPNVSLSKKLPAGLRSKNKDRIKKQQQQQKSMNPSFSFGQAAHFLVNDFIRR